MSQHPLQNPLANQLEEDSQLPTGRETSFVRPGAADLAQYRLPIPEPKRPKLHKVESWLQQWRRRELELQLIPAWRDGALSFAIVTSVAAGPGLLLLSLILFGRAGKQIPLVFNPRSTGARWEPADKIILLIVPAVLSLLLFGLLKIVYNLFKYDQRLASLLCWLITTFNVMIVVAALQIYGLVVR